MMMVAAKMKMTDKLNNPSRANYGGRPPCQNLSGQSDKPPVRRGNNQSMLHSIRWHSFNFNSIHTHSKLAIGLASLSLPVHSLADISSKSCLIHSPLTPPSFNTLNIDNPGNNSEIVQHLVLLKNVIDISYGDWKMGPNVKNVINSKGAGQIWRFKAPPAITLDNALHQAHCSCSNIAPPHFSR